MRRRVTLDKRVVASSSRGRIVTHRGHKGPGCRGIFIRSPRAVVSPDGVSRSQSYLEDQCPEGTSAKDHRFSTDALHSSASGICFGTNDGAGSIIRSAAKLPMSEPATTPATGHRPARKPLPLRSDHAPPRSEGGMPHERNVARDALTIPPCGLSFVGLMILLLQATRSGFYRSDRWRSDQHRTTRGARRWFESA